MPLANSYVLSGNFVSSLEGTTLTNQTVTRQLPPASGNYQEAWWTVQYNGQWDNGSGCIFGVLSSSFYGGNGSQVGYSRSVPRWVVFVSNGDEYGPVQYPELYNDSVDFTSPPLTGWKRENNNQVVGLSISSVTPTPSITPTITPTRSPTPTPSITPTRTPTTTPTSSAGAIQPTSTPTPSITPTIAPIFLTITARSSAVPGFVNSSGGCSQFFYKENYPYQNKWFGGWVNFLTPENGNSNACSYSILPSLFPYNSNTQYINSNLAPWAVRYFPNQQITDLRWAQRIRWVDNISSYLNPASASIPGTGLADLSAVVEFNAARQYNNYIYTQSRAIYVRSFSGINSFGQPQNLSKGGLVGWVAWDGITEINKLSNQYFRLSVINEFGIAASSYGASNNLYPTGYNDQAIVFYVDRSSFQQGAIPTPTPTITPTRTVTPTPTITPTITRTPAITPKINSPVSFSSYSDNFVNPPNRYIIPGNIIVGNDTGTSATSGGSIENTLYYFTYFSPATSVASVSESSNLLLPGNYSLSSFQVYTSYTSIVNGLGSPVLAPQASIVLPYLEYRNVENLNHVFTQSDVNSIQTVLDNFSFLQNVDYVTPSTSNGGAVAYLHPLSSLDNVPLSANVIRIKFGDEFTKAIRQGTQTKRENNMIYFCHMRNNMYRSWPSGGVYSPFYFSLVTIPISGRNEVPGYDTTKITSFGLGGSTVEFNIPLSAKKQNLDIFVDENRNVYRLNARLLSSFDAYSNLRSSGNVLTLGYLNKALNSLYQQNNFSQDTINSIAGFNAFQGSSVSVSQITEPNTLTLAQSSGTYLVSLPTYSLSGFSNGVTNIIKTNNVTAYYTVTATAENQGFSVIFVSNNSLLKLRLSSYNTLFSNATGSVILNPIGNDLFVFSGLGSVDFAVYTQNDNLNPTIILTPELQALVDSGAFDPWINPDLPYSGLWNFLRYKIQSG